MPLEGKIKRTSKKGGVKGLRKRTRPAVVKVGVLSGAGEHNKGTAGQTVAEIAWWNEFGTSRIPARPFLRPTLRKQGGKYKASMKMLIRSMLLGKIANTKAQAVLGLAAQRDIQKAITDLKDPPNADSTKDQKGSSNPLIDTGQMRQTISWVGWS